MEAVEMATGMDMSRVQEEMRREEIRQGGQYTIAPPATFAAPPIALDESEQLLEYRKPRPFAYTPLLFGTLFGLVLFVLFLLSGNAVAILLGAAIWGGSTRRFVTSRNLLGRVSPTPTRCAPSSVNSDKPLNREP